ncbi:hypothetical protein NDJ00_11560 [Vibrio parahaemolyticus]|uniref:hypothetical protein n=1 Tax=Vibrio parahaemolyticus TaxID=670 RepID=UPI00215FA78C|nr:hypothetical protein [Vibrio parahaemolyticus]MCS0114806.1 hypothetical protein [Vibrio parahaemolyticus]
MFNLIISILAIALIVVLSAFGVFYGGQIYTEQQIEAEAAKVRNERSQVLAALELYTSNGNEINDNFDLNLLVDDQYLSKLPLDWKRNEKMNIKVLDQEDPKSYHICQKANEQDDFYFNEESTEVHLYEDGITKVYIPYCNKSDLDPRVPCCTNINE